MPKVRKAVLPVAGLGTRMLPATKSIPKELLPLVDVPCLQLVVEECVASGIEQVVLVTAHGKEALVDHFDRSADLEQTLERKGKKADLEAVRRLVGLCEVVSVRQADPRGLGHAVLCARPVVGNEPFAVLLPDDIVEGKPPGIGQMIAAFDKVGTGIVALQEVPHGHEHMYGIVQGTRVEGRTWKLEKLVEKPAAGTAPSRLAVIGRYVLPAETFEILARTPLGRGDEIQLTDALATLCRERGLHGVELDGIRFDAGDRAGYVLATLYYALRRPDIGVEVRAGVEKLLREMGPAPSS